MLVETGVRWDMSADVIVIGYGCAGAVAAATAQDEGANTLILEKQPSHSHHSNSSMSGGGFVSPSDIDGARQHLEALCRVGEELYWTDKDIIRVWAEYAADNSTWVEANGGKAIYMPQRIGHYPHIPGCDALSMYGFKEMGPGLAQFLSEQVRKRNIPVVYDTPALRLLTNMNGEVVGVEAESHAEEKAKRIRVRASKGVIMTCGGFEFNETMKLNYLKVHPTHFYGTEANTGDGITMAMEVGADLWHMNCVAAHFVLKFPDFAHAFCPDFKGQARLGSDSGGGELNAAKRCGYICIDRYGQRFTNENIKAHVLYYELALFDSQRLVYPRVPSYWIIDRKRIELGSLPRLDSGPTGPTQLYQWSMDNSTEIKKGWILTAKTIRDLARLLEMSPDILEDTVATYNKYCESGSDPDFGRESSDLIPLEEPPYYAVKLWPGGTNTQGGPRRNAKAEVLNLDGEPIPGLYSAGELGSIYGMVYPIGGGNLGECMAFGRIAGGGAARRVV
ncbi:FAD-dependent oxidoreductase [Chloroflexota bacterium]